MKTFVKALLIEHGGSMSVEEATMHVAADDEDGHVMFDKMDGKVVAYLLRDTDSTIN